MICCANRVVDQRGDDVSDPSVSAPAPAASGAPAARPLALAVKAMGGTWLGTVAPSVMFEGAAADSRLVRSGQLFFALPGERVDGYDFCGAAVMAGAAALVVDASHGMPQALPTAPGRGGVSVPVIGVADPLAALADLARAVRATFTGRVVGITGSNGKTTTKELTAAALGSAGRVLRTEGSYNTEIGLPLTILSASGTEDFWVLEMAMRGRGQIALLADIARPHVGVITNVAGAHLELLGSIEEVARAKGELFAGLESDGIAVLPGGDALIEAQAFQLPEARKLRFDGGGPGPKDVVILDSLPGGIAGQVVRYAVRRQPVVARLPSVDCTTPATRRRRWRWRPRSTCRHRRRRARLPRPSFRRIGRSRSTSRDGSFSTTVTTPTQRRCAPRWPRSSRLPPEPPVMVVRLPSSVTCSRLAPTRPNCIARSVARPVFGWRGSRCWGRSAPKSPAGRPRWGLHRRVSSPPTIPWRPPQASPRGRVQATGSWSRRRARCAWNGRLPPSRRNCARTGGAHEGRAKMLAGGAEGVLRPTDRQRGGPFRADTPPPPSPSLPLPVGFTPRRERLSLLPFSLSLFFSFFSEEFRNRPPLT